MQLSIEFDPESRYVLIRAWDKATPEDMRNMSIALTSHPSWRAGMNALMDARELETGHLKGADIQAMVNSAAQFNDRMGGGKGAIVVSEDLAYGLARMWGAHAENRLTTRNRVFRSMEEAIRWLVGPSDEDGEGEAGR
jgi:hypothetical protein